MRFFQRFDSAESRRQACLSACRGAKTCLEKERYGLRIGLSFCLGLGVGTATLYAQAAGTASALAAMPAPVETAVKSRPAPAVKATAAAESRLTIALLKYRGGGDWYANPTSLSGLIRFCNTEAPFRLQADYATVEVGSPDLFDYPFVHMTGHGNVVFSEAEAENLRRYLTGGGFLHIDDNYGLDAFVRREMKKVFPEQDFVPVPLTHPIFNQVFDYSRRGLPKIHEHDNKAPQAFALVHEGRIVCFYTYECDLGDGWEDGSVHGDSEAIRRQALEMGCNILTYAFHY